jgi:hypothetical protein
MSKASIIARAAATLGVLTATVSGVTMAALQSTATLSDNTVSSATAELQVSKTTPCGETGFASTLTGFNFTGIVPGSATATSTQHFCLKNTGTANMNVVFAIPTLPTYSNSGGSVTVDNTKVHVALTCGTLPTVNTTIDALFTTVGGVTVGTLNATDNLTCDVTVSMDANAFTGSSVTSTGFSLVFTGTGI